MITLNVTILGALGKISREIHVNGLFCADSCPQSDPSEVAYGTVCNLFNEYCGEDMDYKTATRHNIPRCADCLAVSGSADDTH